MKQNLEQRMKDLQEVIDETNSHKVQRGNATKEYDKCRIEIIQS